MVKAVEDFSSNQGWGGTPPGPASVWVGVPVIGESVQHNDGTVSTETTYNVAVNPYTGASFALSPPVVNHIRIGRTASKTMLAEAGATGVTPGELAPPFRPIPQPPSHNIYHAFFIEGDPTCHIAPHGQWSLGWIEPWTYFHHDTTCVVIDNTGAHVMVTFTAQPDPLESLDWEYPSAWAQYLSLGGQDGTSALRMYMRGFGWDAYCTDWGCID